MRGTDRIFHLAVPCADLDDSVRFYTRLGCRLARRYADRATFDFFGDQLVCHLSPDEVTAEPRMYPRHFGINFLERSGFDAQLEHARSEGLPFFKEPFQRFAGSPEEHWSFFLIDPANNLIEFKHYADPRMSH